MIGALWKQSLHELPDHLSGIREGRIGKERVSRAALCTGGRHVVGLARVGVEEGERHGGGGLKGSQGPARREGDDAPAAAHRRQVARLEELGFEAAVAEHARERQIERGGMLLGGHDAQRPVGLIGASVGGFLRGRLLSARAGGEQRGRGTGRAQGGAPFHLFQN